MGDPYPTHLNIEIDRDRLRRCLRVTWLCYWFAGFLFYGGLISFGFAADAIGKRDLADPHVIWLWLLKFGECLGGCLLVALLCYFLFSHWIAGRVAESLQVTVEGSFLRIRQHVFMLSDRKLHFRAIVDYTAMQHFLMRRYGLYSIRMTTIGGGPRSFVTIPGIKDGPQIRDTLADIDRLRENE
jgi:hypothetical protein